MFARFDENPAMTLRVIKETKRYGRTDARTDGRTDGQCENSIPPTNKVCGGGYKNEIIFSWKMVKIKHLLKGVKLNCHKSSLKTKITDYQRSLKD